MIQRIDEFKYIFEDEVRKIKHAGEQDRGMFYLLSHPDLLLDEYVERKEILINRKTDIIIDCSLLGANLIEHLFNQLRIKSESNKRFKISNKKEFGASVSLGVSGPFISPSLGVSLAMQKIERSQYKERLEQIINDLQNFKSWIWFKNVESITKDSLYQLNVLIDILGDIQHSYKMLLTETSFTGIYEMYEALNVKSRIENIQVYRISINLHQAIYFLEKEGLDKENIEQFKKIFQNQNITFTPELVKAIRNVFSVSENTDVSYELIGRQLLTDIGIEEKSLHETVSILKLLNSFTVGKGIEFISNRAYISTIQVKEIITYLQGKRIVYQIHMNNYELNPIYRSFFPVVFNEIEVIQFEKREFNADDYYQIRFNKVVELLQVLKKQHYEQTVFYLLHLFILENYTIGDDRHGKEIFQYDENDQFGRGVIDSMTKQFQNMSFQFQDMPFRLREENIVLDKIKTYFDMHALTNEMNLTDTKIRSEDVLQLAKIHRLKYLQRMKLSKKDSSDRNIEVMIVDKLRDTFPQKEYKYYFVVEVLSFLTLGPLILEYYAENEKVYNEHKDLFIEYPNHTENEMTYNDYCSLLSKMFIEYMQKVEELSYTDTNWKYIFIEMLFVANAFLLPIEKIKLEGKLEYLLNEIIEKKHQISLKKRLRFLNLYIATEVSNETKLKDVIEEIVKEEDMIIYNRYYWAGLLNNIIRINMNNELLCILSQEMIEKFLVYYINDLQKDIEQTNVRYHEGEILLNTVFVYAIQNGDDELCQLISDYIVRTQADTINSRYYRYYLETNCMLYQLQNKNKEILNIDSYESNFLNSEEVEKRCDILKKMHRAGASKSSDIDYITSGIEYWYD